MYYGSYRAPRTIVWVIGTIIFIVLVATAFMGYTKDSPKWFNIKKFFKVIRIQDNPGVVYTVRPSLNRELRKVMSYNRPHPISKLATTHINKSFDMIRTRKEILNKSNISLTSSNIRLDKERGCCLLRRSVPHYTTVRRCSISTNSKRSEERLNTILKELDITPVFIFDNLVDLRSSDPKNKVSEKKRQEVLNTTRGLSGIYMIINKVTKDYYVGSASTNRIYSRFCSHLIYFLGSKVVKAAVKKYGLKNFSFIVLELFPKEVNQETNRELLDLEDMYLKLLLPNYNILTEAGSSFGYKHSEIDRNKMKDNYSDARREKIGSLNRGKILSPETIERMRQSALKRKPMSEETKAKCSRTHTRAVVLYNLNDTIFGKYSTMEEAANAINCSARTLRRALATPKKLVKKQWIIKDLGETD
jgi:group I intron endonuclease